MASVNSKSSGTSYKSASSSARNINLSCHGRCNTRVNVGRTMLKRKPAITNRQPKASFQHVYRDKNVDGKVMNKSYFAKTIIRRNQSTIQRHFSDKKKLGKFLTTLFQKKTTLIEAEIKRLNKQLGKLKPSKNSPAHIKNMHAELKNARNFYISLVVAMKKQKAEHIKAYTSRLLNKNVTITRWPMYISKDWLNPEKTTLYFHPSTGVEETHRAVSFLEKELQKNSSSTPRRLFSRMWK